MLQKKVAEMILLLSTQQATEKMDNKFSGGHYNLKNEKSDEENRVPSSKKDDPPSIKDNPFERNQSEYTQLHHEKEENVAENINTFNSSNKYSQSKKIVPLPLLKNVPNKHLVHNNNRIRKYIKKEEIKKLANEKYEKNGVGITVIDIQSKFRLTKKQAQRQLKHFTKSNVLFTAEDLRKQGIDSQVFKKAPKVLFG